jgi:hypothetical protein
MNPQIPTPGLVAYELSATVTNEETGEVKALNAKEYPTQACCEFVKQWLENDPRTSPVGPFTITSENESAFPWRYSVPFREIVTTNNTSVDPGLWYALIQQGGPNLNQPIKELVGDATGQVF